MNQFKSEVDRYTLEQFHYWLTNGLYSGFLMFTAIFLPLIIALPLICLVVIVFSVYVIRTLVQIYKRGWIIGYAVSMFFPMLIALVLSESEIAGNVGWFLPICVFYFYCFILRYSVGEWIGDLSDEKADKLRVKHEDEIKEMMEKSRKDSF